MMQYNLSMMQKREMEKFMFIVSKEFLEVPLFV